MRDFYGSRGLAGYVVTSKGREVLGRLADALGTPGAPRAWSVSGPYGGGKSAFALFAARLLRGDADALAHLAASDAPLAERVARVSGAAWCPVLVVGARGPVVDGLGEGLARALDAFAADVPAGTGRRADVARQAAALADEARAADAERAVVDVYGRAAALVHARTGGGLFVVVDELGKHLEHAALHPGTGDLFVLQSLAERAAGPGPPLALVTILHQAFERYAVGLSSAQRDDWRKVQGRFEDVAFVEPVGEALRLLAAAIDADLPKEEREEGARAVDAVLEAATLPPRLDAAAVADRLRQSLPLHPSVALLVGPLFRRLAQNERSLFSFLASGEPRSFLDVAGDGGLYRLDHLYDYLVGTLGGALYHDGAGRLWAETETALLRVESALQERVLKQVAVLSFAGALAGLAPTEAALLASSGDPPEATRAALGALREARALAYRPFRDEYRVWEGGDVDLATAVRDARASISQRTPLADTLAAAAPPTPLVARRHAYETGTTRVFTVAYAAADGWRARLDAALATDGRVIYVLPEDTPAADVVADVLAATAGARPTDLVCVLDGLTGLRDLARDLAALDAVRRDPALDGDAAARRELDVQRADLAAALDHRLTTALASGGVWVQGGERVAVPADGLQPLLSDACDRAFPHAPRVPNELLNRRAPSSNAVRAQKALLRALAEHPTAPRLGIEGTPAEYGLYASVLQATGLHQETAPGVWALVAPDAPGVEPGVAAAVGALAEAVGAARAAPVPVPDLYDALRAAPFGVRDGLLPVFLFATLVRLGDRVAVFEDGVYQWELSTEAVERLLRRPASFAVQSVRASAAQRAVLAALAPRVGLAAGAGLRPLPVVGRVLQAVSGLPAYVRKTTTLSDAATAVREALVRATEPAALLFRDLPAALGEAPFDAEPPDAGRAERYADALADALRELSGAYDALLADLDDDLAAAFDLGPGAPDAHRAALAARARALVDEAVDGALRSFVVRAADDLADTRAWTESLAALLARTPPAQWADADRQRFASALADVAGPFLRREAVAFAPADDADRAHAATRFRLSVTATHEAERQTVVSVHPEDAETVEAVAARVAAALDAGDEALDTHLAALSQLSLALLTRRAQGDPAPDPTP